MKRIADWVAGEALLPGSKMAVLQYPHMAGGIKGTFWLSFIRALFSFNGRPHELITSQRPHMQLLSLLELGFNI